MIKPIGQIKNKNYTGFNKIDTTVVKPILPENDNDTLSITKSEFPWVTNPIITSALDELKKVKFALTDLIYLQNLGLEIPFTSGEDAINFIKSSNLRISFDDTGAEGIHAQYNYNENKIMLNKKYKNTSDTADVLALAEAILHESAHAKDNDSASSIQEELNNLGMGALAHRFFEKKYPEVFNHAKTLIVNDGVNIYAKIFFDKDKNKKALKERVRQKYGLLPAGDNLHTPSKLALNIKNGEIYK